MVEKNDTIVLRNPSPLAAKDLMEEIMQEIEDKLPLKRHWNLAVNISKKKLGREELSYKDFRESLVTGLTEVIRAERNGWILLEDGPPPINEIVRLWLVDQKTLVMAAILHDRKHTVLEILGGGGEVELKNISRWQLITAPMTAVPVEDLVNEYTGEELDPGHGIG